MKLSSSSSSSSNKPISSPSRVEKFPPPLMRFLRSNGGSRSRSRSGRRRSSRLSSSSSTSSSPMFVIRKKSASSSSSSSSSNGIETTQTTHEPSSPKVSCMGKVHVHHHHQRSSKSKSKQNPSLKTLKCSSFSCRWIQKALFCKCLQPKFPDWRRKCCLFFQFGYRKKDEIIEEEEVKTESRRQFTVSYEENSREEEEEEEKEEMVFTSSSSSTIPPKNALLLMRCRSDPCRNRFLGGFPTVTDEKPEFSSNKIKENEEIPTLEKEPIFIDSASESEEKRGFCDNGRKRGNIRKNGGLMKVNGGSSSSSRSLPPLTLARCKSESETCYWNKRKNSGFDEKCPPLLL